MLRQIEPITDQTWKWLEARVQQAASSVAVGGIVTEVLANPEIALKKYTTKFDGVTIDNPVLTEAKWAKLAAQCPELVQASIQENWNRIVRFHELQKPREAWLEEEGVKLGRIPVPLDVIAAYAPGGTAVYPSTVLMTLACAKIAGVKTRILVTPPNRQGFIDPSVAFAAIVAGATHVLLAGGAQAIAAVVAGVHRLPPVQAVLGPGNVWVTAAKEMLSSRIRIDVPAGPSELLIIADDSSNARFIALDLLAQAEHDIEAEVIVVSTSKNLLRLVQEELLALAPRTARAEIITGSLEKNARFFFSNHIEEIIEFANQYAAEHLTIVTKNPEEILPQIRAAGSVFLGEWSPVAAGDYGSGTNHVLPTRGRALQRGGLMVEDCIRWITVQKISHSALSSMESSLATLADHEGLSAHAESIRGRINNA